MILTVDGIKELISPVAKKHNLAAVYLFGSHARGDATGDSDIDLLVDLSGSSVKGFGFGRLSNELESVLDAKVDLLTTNNIERKNPRPSQQRLRSAVLKDRLALYER